MNNKGSSLTPAQALEKLDALYEQSVNALRSAISDYIETGKLPDDKGHEPRAFLFIHQLSVTWDGSASKAIRKPAPMRVSPTPAVTPRPSRDPDAVPPLPARTAYPAVSGLRRAYRALDCRSMRSLILT